MNKRDKRDLYRFLNTTFGNPGNMSEHKRRLLVTLFGGWVGQHTLPARRRNLVHALTLVERLTQYEVPTRTIFERHSQGVYVAQPRWHWHINSRIMLPKSKSHMPRYVDEGIYAHRSKGWDWVEKGVGKSLTVVIPINYNAVVPEPIRIVGRKMVQRAWNHRVYSDKQVWECTYWDFSKLSKDEDSFNEVTWSEGYAVLMATGAAVETTLTRAISMARSRTIKAGVRSILSDADT